MAEHSYTLRTADVAALLQTPERTVRYWAKTRRLPYQKLNHVLRFDPADVEAFKAAGEYRKAA